VATLHGQAMFDEMKNTCREVEASMGKRLFLARRPAGFRAYNELLPMTRLSA